MGFMGELDAVACGHLGSRRHSSSASVFVPTHVALSRFGYVYTSSVGRNGADQNFCRLRKLFLSAMPFIGCLFPLIHRSSAQHGYYLVVRCNFEGDHVVSMTALIDAEVALARPGKTVHADETRVEVSVVLADGGSGLGFLMEECPTSLTVSWQTIQEADHEIRVVVGLPDGGVLDFVDHLHGDNQGYVE